MTGGRRVQQVIAELRERIALGDYGPAGALESESELGSRYAVSRITIRSALESLRAEGLVASRKGSGWFVARGSFGQQLALGTFQHAGSAVEATGLSISRTVVEYSFSSCPTPIDAVLGIERGAEVLRVSSVRRTDGVPLDTVTEWVPAALAVTISRRDAEEPGIWSSIGRQGHQIALVRQSIAATEATAPTAELLEIAPGAAVLHVRRIAVDSTDTVLAVSDHRYVGHRFRLDVEFRGWPSTAVAEPPGVTAVDGASTTNH